MLYRKNKNFKLICFQLSLDNLPLVQEKTEEKIEEVRKKDFPDFEADLVEFSYTVDREHKTMFIFAGVAFV